MTTQKTIELTDSAILEMGHRRARTYRHDDEPKNIGYGFDRSTLLDFARASIQADRAQRQAEPSPGDERDKWKMVDADCRDGSGGLLTYHVDAFDEGYKFGTAQRQAEPVAQVVSVYPPGPDGHGVNWLKGKRPKPGDLLYTAPPPAQVPLTHDDVRAAGGMVHGDGNIFFTNIDKLNAACGTPPR